MREFCFVVLSTLGLLYAQDYRPPLNGPLLITGTFGELRSNHYHAGLDFRAPIGTPVYAVADGYVSRLLAKGGGYGQAVYIDHPDGRRSVYGHLESLAPRLLDTLRDEQYARETFALDLHLDAAALPVKRGEQIGTVGNRGFSFGPHLHFEIREAAGDVPLNPLSLGYPVPDTRRPELLRLRAYELGPEGQDLRSTTYTLSQGLPDTLRVGTPIFGLGVAAYDRQNGMPNRNGIYGARLLVDSVKHFAFTYDRIPYEDSEYLNALTDYAAWQEKRQWYYLLFARTPRALFWKDRPDGADDETGLLHLSPDRPINVSVELHDFAGNTTATDFVVVYEPGLAPPAAASETYTYLLPADEPSIIDTVELRLELGAKALYGDLKFQYRRLDDPSDGYASHTHQLHHSLTPLHGGASLHLRPRPDLPDSLRRRVYLGRCNDAKHQPIGGEWTHDGRLHARIRSFGNYALLVDTVPPRIRIERFGTDLRGRDGFSLLIDDAVGGPLDYRGTIDGAWVLLEYDAKSGRLSHIFDATRMAVAGGGMHDFVLRVRDGRGNERSFRRRFRR